MALIHTQKAVYEIDMVAMLQSQKLREQHIYNKIEGVMSVAGWCMAFGAKGIGR